MKCLAQYNIYHREREFAYTHGDPLLGTIVANSAEQAETIALNRGLGSYGVGLLAVRCSEKTLEFPIPGANHATG